jgi:hypothetical protein
MAHAAFAARIADSCGAPDALLADYLIEQRLDTPGIEEPLFLARARETGVRVWLKCAATGAAPARRIANEAQLLRHLNHPHITSLAAASAPDGAAWLAYAWQAGTPLSTARLDELPQVDRVRLALDLLATVGYLQGLEQPVAHNHLELESLWVSSELCWLRLAQFGEAVADAGAEELAAERKAAWRLALKLAQPAAGAESQMQAAAQGWMAQGGAEALAVLLGRLKLLLLEQVAQDL